MLSQIPTKQVTLSCLFIILMGCTKFPVFRGIWYCYYESGLSHLEQGAFLKAEHDFKHAIEGRTDDCPNARTYGMHLIQYFLHRALGILYYKTGRFEKAVVELEKSLKTIDSKTVRYYLNKANNAIYKKYL